MLQLKIIRCLLGLILFSGCASKKQSTKIDQKNNDLVESVAGLTHVPDAPFGFRLHKVVHDSNNPENIQIVYYPKKTVKIDLQDVKKIYITDMEILGWDLINQFEHEHEFLLMFVRPSNIWCHVRLDDNNILTVIILSEKKIGFKPTFFDVPV